MDYRPPGSSVHGIFQATILEWIATSFSRGSSWPRNQTWVYCICRQILYRLSYEEAPWLSSKRAHIGLPWWLRWLKTKQNTHTHTTNVVRIWRKGHAPILLGEIKTGVATVENSMEVPWKTKNRTTMYVLSRFSHVWLFATLWTIAFQAPLSLEFSRQEYWSGHRHKEQTFGFSGRRRWWNDLREERWNMYITICKIKFYAWNRAPKAGALGQPRGGGWGGKWKGDSGWRVHMYTYGWFMLMYDWNHHNIVIILQLK